MTPLRQYLADTVPDAVLLEGPEFDGGIVGTSSDGRVVYSYTKLVESLEGWNGRTHEDAVEWLDYNTLRSIPYADDHAPVVVFDIPDDL